MPQKMDLLYILDNTKSQDELKYRLKNYQGGYAYMYLLHNYFPLLRNACSLSIYYTTPLFNYNKNIENGLSLMKDKKYAKALSLLISEKENPLIWNNLGICFMMTNNWEEAKKYFQKAIKTGSADALFNLEMIE
ncbi:MAG: tetratricopeptide repeat protein [Bacteroidales bacterium]